MGTRVGNYIGSRPLIYSSRGRGYYSPIVRRSRGIRDDGSPPETCGLKLLNPRQDVHINGTFRRVKLSWGEIWRSLLPWLLGDLYTIDREPWGVQPLVGDARIAIQYHNACLQLMLCDREQLVAEMKRQYPTLGETTVHRPTQHSSTSGKSQGQ